MRHADIENAIGPARCLTGLVAALLFFCVCGTARAVDTQAMIEADGNTSKLIFEQRDDLVTLQAHDMSLQDVLEAIARKCNLRIVLYRPLESRISIAFESRPLAEILTRLLRRQSYLLHLSPAQDSTGIVGHDKTGTLWVYSGHNAERPNKQIIELGGWSDTAAAVAALQSNLVHGDFRRKKAAIEDLRKLGDSAAIDGLSLALADEDGRIRAAAIHALGDIGGENAIAALAGATVDEDAWVRQEASYALGSIGGESAIQQLSLTLNDADHMVRDATISALGEIGGRRSAATLSVLLRDQDLSTRVNTVDALGEIGGDAARPYLEEALNDENEFVRERVAAYLKDAADAEARNRF